jgi:signal transduction histidine kinase
MITKKIVEEHGGVIEMTSKKSEGSIFRIRLPDKKEA